jgi:hypothetical protein
LSLALETPADRYTYPQSFCRASRPLSTGRSLSLPLDPPRSCLLCCFKRTPIKTPCRWNLFSRMLPWEGPMTPIRCHVRWCTPVVSHSGLFSASWAANENFAKRACWPPQQQKKAEFLKFLIFWVLCHVRSIVGRL